MKFGEKLIHIFFVKINKDVYDVIFVVNKCTRRKSHYNSNHNPQYN
jgi:hypothetical protein